MAWLGRRLTALAYPSAKTFALAMAIGRLRTPSLTFREPDPKDVRALVAWVEESKLQHWKSDTRAALLSQATSEAEWKAEFINYLHSLGCRRETEDVAFQLEWLLSHTLAIEHSAADEHVQLDFPPYNSSELKAAVEELARALKYPLDADHKLVLSVVLQHLHRRFVSPPGEGAVAFTLRDANLPIGFDTGDAYMNAGATVLRLLFVQTRINEVIMMAQNITANPRTDLNLGKVGK